MLQAVGVLAAFVLTVAGVLALRRAWAVNSRSRLWIQGGWLALVSATVGWTAVADGDKAVALALLMPSLVAYAVVASGAKLKRGRAGRVRDSIDPLPGGARIWRGLARCLLAGPVSAAAAIAIGAIVALHAPWDEADRIVAAGLLAPTVWAACLCWSLSDGRLRRVALGLAVVLAAASAVAL